MNTILSARTVSIVREIKMNKKEIILYIILAFLTLGLAAYHGLSGDYQGMAAWLLLFGTDTFCLISAARE